MINVCKCLRVFGSGRCLAIAIYLVTITVCLVRSHTGLVGRATGVLLRYSQHRAVTTRHQYKLDDYNMSVRMSKLDYTHVCPHVHTCL